MPALAHQPLNSIKTEGEQALVPLIHIGYAKAASSWTQNFFRNEKSGFIHPFSHSDALHEYILRPNALDFDAQLSRSALSPPLIAAQEQGQIPVLTAESLVGHWSSGGYNTKEIADRLYQIFPHARILIIIREQKSILNSVYRQYIRKGGTRRLKDFVHPPRKGKSRGPSFSFEFFNYERAIKYYQQLFTPKNVCVLPYELLKKDAVEYINSITKFAGSTPSKDILINHASTNTGLSAIHIGLKRRLNPFISKDALNDYSSLYHPYFGRLASFILPHIDRIAPSGVIHRANHKLSEEISDLIGNRYLESNKNCSELIGMDLRKYSYDCKK